MDDRIRICLWLIGGGAFGALLGSVFGGLTGAMLEWNGRAAGTGLAQRIADTFEHTALQKPTPLRRAIVVGATDGFLFLGVIGLTLGLLLGRSDRGAELLLPVLAGSVFLIGGATCFGLLAYFFSRGADSFDDR